MAAEYRLIDDVTQWWAFHQSRNLTLHIYDEAVAEEVFATAVIFLPAAQKLPAVLTAHND